MENYIVKGNKKLKYGYTTGTCAAAASKAAALMLLTKKRIENISIETPKGWEITLDLHDIKISKDFVSCAIKKDSGDDPDITNGVLVYSNVKLNPIKEVQLSGGIGVGTVTKKGLSVNVGQPAINPIPRKMIIDEVKHIANKCNYSSGFFVEISVPQGIEISKKTFNPKLGIVNGISILGTSGIVEPMSEDALIQSLKLEMKMIREKGKRDILLCPGNYGVDFATNEMLLDVTNGVKISNYIGVMFDYARELGFKNVLLVGHAGKLVKVSGGIMNTHNRFSDSRMEIIAANTVLHTDKIGVIKEILECITTDATVDLLINEGLCEIVFNTIVNKIDYYILKRTYEEINVGTVIFTKTHGLLSISENAKNIINFFRKDY